MLGRTGSFNSHPVDVQNRCTVLQVDKVADVMTKTNLYKATTEMSLDEGARQCNGVGFWGFARDYAAL